MDGADNFFGGGVDGLEGLAVNTLHPLVVDEPGKGNLLVALAVEGMRGNAECVFVFRRRNLQSSGLSVLASRWRRERDGSHCDCIMRNVFCVVVFVAQWRRGIGSRTRERKCAGKVQLKYCFEAARKEVRHTLSRLL